MPKQCCIDQSIWFYGFSIAVKRRKRRRNAEWQIMSHVFPCPCVSLCPPTLLSHVFSLCVCLFVFVCCGCDYLLPADHYLIKLLQKINPGFPLSLSYLIVQAPLTVVLYFSQALSFLLLMISPVLQTLLRMQACMLCLITCRPAHSPPLFSFSPTCFCQPPPCSLRGWGQVAPQQICICTECGGQSAIWY